MKEVQRLQQELSSIKSQSLLDMKQLKIEKEQLELQLLSLKDNTNLGKITKENEDLRKQVSILSHKIIELEEDIESMNEEKETLLQQVDEYDTNLDQKISDKVQREKNQIQTLSIAIEKLKQEKLEDSQYYLQLEKEKVLLSEEVANLNSWKAIYEAGHGYEQLSKHQQKLTNDNRRFQKALEQRTDQIGSLIDANNMLTLAFEKLKKETGKPINFKYPELELQNEVTSTLFSLQIQLKQVEEQLSSMENENIKLRKQLRDSLITITESGFKFPGLTPDLLIKINDFAINLRDGKLELPLDDRSKELLKENQQLKTEMKALQHQLAEGGGGTGGGKGKRKAGRQMRREGESNKKEVLLSDTTAAAVSSSGKEHAMITFKEEDEEEREREREGQFSARGEGLEEGSSQLDYYDSEYTENYNLKVLLENNQQLSNKISSLQSQLEFFMKQSTLTSTSIAAGAGGERISASAAATAAGGFLKVDDLALIINKNNELLLKEIEDVRKHSGQPSHHHLPSSTGGGIATSSPAYLPPSGRHGGGGGHPTHHIPTGRLSRIPPSTDQKPIRGSTVLGTPMRPYSAGGGGVGAWTPAGKGGNLSFSSPFSQPGGVGVSGGVGPATPHGKQLLSTTLHSMNLPPEEWTNDIKEVTGYLIETLEQLYEREQDLETQKALIRNFEENVSEMKLQMTLVYHDYSSKRTQWIEKEKTLIAENKTLLHEREDYKLRFKRTNDMLELLKKEDTKVIENELKELTRKVTIYEINETILSRKYTALQETLENETKRRYEISNDFIEMESLLKQRILYLEQYKVLSSKKIGFLQMKVDSSIPQDDYLTLSLELDSLREDHLNTLRREVESRILSLQSIEYEKENRQLKLLIAQSTIDLEKNQETILHLEKELFHQKEFTENRLLLMKSTEEISKVISEMARYRGEASRLEVELLSSNHKLSLLSSQMNDSLQQLEKQSNRIIELEKREIEYCEKESSARKDANMLKLQYQNGLTKEEKDKLLSQLTIVTKNNEEKSLEVNRLHELLTISTRQTESIKEIRYQYSDELTELREYCLTLESRKEDDSCIGRLQRQLISMKASYKSFVKKYHISREDLRKREIAMRLLENRILELENGFLLEKEKASITIHSLKTALKNIKETIVQSTPNLIQTTINTAATTAATSGGLTNPLTSPRSSGNFASAGVSASSAANNATPGEKVITVRANNAFGKNKYYTIGLGSKLVEINEKVETLSLLAEQSVLRANEKEQQNKDLSSFIEDLSLEKQQLLQRIHDILLTSKASEESKAITERLLTLSRDLTATKLANLKEKRQISLLREENKYLKNLLMKMEYDVNELEKGKVELEIHKSILFDQKLPSITKGMNGKGMKGKKHSSKKKRLFLDRTEEGDDDDDDGDDEEEDEEERLLFELGRLTASREGGVKGKGEDMKTSLSRLSVDTTTNDLIDINNNSNTMIELSSEDYQKRITDLSSQCSFLRKQVSDSSLQVESLKGHLSDASQTLEEKDNQLSYYERILSEHHLQNVILRQREGGTGVGVGGGGYRPHSGRGGPTSHHQPGYLMPESDQAKLQEAASATISSLTKLLEEKNQLIDSLRKKNEELTSSQPTRSNADRKADDLLSNRNITSNERDEETEDEYYSAAGGGRRSPSGKRKHGKSGKESGVSTEVMKRLQEQLETADYLISEKDSLIKQLESHFSMESHKCQRAEQRCGEILRECEALKHDLQVLMKIMKDNNIRSAHVNSVKRRWDNLEGGEGGGSPGRGGSKSPTRRGESNSPIGKGRKGVVGKGGGKGGGKAGKGGDDDWTVDTRGEGEGEGGTGETEDHVIRRLYDELDMLKENNKKSSEKVNELKKKMKEKVDVIAKYHETLVKLKDEFIKAEEEKATEEIRLKLRKDVLAGAKDDDEDGGRSGGRLISPEELRDLKEKVSELATGLRNAKQDLEKAKKIREKLLSSNNELENENHSLKETVEEKEKQYILSTNLSNKYRKEVEDLRKKEVRMKETIKELKKAAGTTMEGDEGGGGGGGEGGKPKTMKEAYKYAKDQIQTLQQDNELLKAQIAAIIKYTGGGKGGKGGKGGGLSEMLEKEFKEYNSNLIIPRGTATEEAEEEEEGDAAGEGGDSHQRGASGGYILGGPGSTASGLPPTDWRAQLAEKWEKEKKLQKKVGLLEKKVNELTTNNEDLKLQLLKTKDNLHTTQQTKDDIQRKMTSANKQITETKKLTIHEITELEQVRKKTLPLSLVFSFSYLFLFFCVLSFFRQMRKSLH
jgi:hypothetical protein